jgi:hypothetical protein
MGKALRIPEQVAVRCARDALPFDGQDVFDELVRRVNRIVTTHLWNDNVRR